MQHGEGRFQRWLVSYLIESDQGGMRASLFVPLTLVLMLLALWLRLALAPVDAGLQYVTFFPSVTLAAILAGYRAGLIATIIGVAFATYFFTPPYYSFSHEVLKLSLWSNLVFLGDGIIVSLSIEAMHRFRNRYRHELRLIKRSEEQLRVLNGELSALIEKQRQTEADLKVLAAAFDAQDAVMITDSQAKIVRVNRTFQQITGYAEAEVLGLNPKILSSGRHDSAFFSDMWRQIKCTGAWAGEIWDKRKDGQIYPKQMTITAVKAPDGGVVHYVAIFTDISERKKYEDEIRDMAFADALTGLPNRRLLLNRLSVAVSASARSGQFGALMFLDLDKFKVLNDTLGHDYGDLLLIEVAARIKSCVREVDTVARLGGDEFVVLVENLSDGMEVAQQGASKVAEKIREVLANPYQLRSQPYHSSPSIGLCMFSGADSSVDDLLKRADQAMYRAKTTGRNRVCLFDSACTDYRNDLAGCPPL